MTTLNKGALRRIWPVLASLTFAYPSVGVPDPGATDAQMPAPGTKTTAAADSAVASWGKGRRLSRADYEQWRAWRHADDSDEAVKELVFMLSLAEAAEKSGTANDLAVRVAVEAMRQNVLSQALERHVASETKVTDAEVETLAREHPEAFHRPRKLLLRNLFLKLPQSKKEAQEVRKHMEALRKKVLDGAKFKELARHESQSQTRFRDGMMGRFAPSDLPPAVASAVRGLKAGAVSEIVEQGGGLSIFYCERVDEAVVPDAKTVRERIHKNLLRQRSRQRWTQLSETLLKEAHNPAPLGKEELAALVAQRMPGRTLDQLKPEQVEKLQADWTLEKLRAERAVALGLDRTPAVVAALRWSRTQVLSRRELMRQAKASLKTPSDQEVRKFFDTHRGRYRKLPEFKLAVIQFGEGDAQTVERAREVVAKIDRKELSFEQAAREYSKDPSAKDGGSLGWRSIGQLANWDLTILKAAGRLKPGDNTGLLNTKTGIWVVELQDRKQVRPMTFAEASAAARRDFQRLATRQMEKTLYAKTLQDLAIKIHRSQEQTQAPPANPAPKLPKGAQASPASPHVSPGR